MKGEAIDVVEIIALTVPMCLMCYALISVMLLVQMKFGAEKSRMVLFGLVGGFLVIGYLFSLASERLQTVAWIVSMAANISDTVLLIGAIAVVLIIILGSMALSIRVMEKKEL